MQLYQSRAVDLSVQDGCLLWGSRVIVPPQSWKAVFELIHESHPRVTRKKWLACGSLVAWNGYGAGGCSKEVCEVPGESQTSTKSFNALLGVVRLSLGTSSC